MEAVEPRPVRVHVASAGNAFMADIASWITEAAAVSGHESRIVRDVPPVADGSINLVVAPHEFYLLGEYRPAAVDAAARCSIPVCTEQPGTSWFRRSLGYCVGSPIVLDINADGVAAFRHEGFRVRRLQLGAVPSMDRQAPSSETSLATRQVDVVFLGGLTDHRETALASLAPRLWNRSCDLRMFPFRRPIVGGEPGLVFGQDKYDLLARSKVLINLHRDSGPDHYFEWARIVEAMTNGCVVVTEPSTGNEPLAAGTHFVESDVDSMGDTLDELLGDDAARRRIADAAHAEVTGPLALAGSLGEVLAVAGAEGMCLGEPTPGRMTRRTRGRFRVRDDQPPLFPAYRPYREARRAIYDEFVAEVEHRREIGRLRARIEHGDDQHVDVHDSAAWPSARAEVSVVATLFDYADTIVETLDSIVASQEVEFEVVVVDDASRDRGAQVVRRWIDEHSAVAVRLVSCAANRGLPAARNVGLGHARADKVMMMDADNVVYPTCLRRLADALEAEPDAAFAYATLEAFGASPGLRSAFGWHVPWLCDAPYIDAQAMLRRSTVMRHGGYRSDATAYGWEDWDLWLNLAANGEHGVHVTEMLGRYRTHPSSMVSFTNLAEDRLRDQLVARYPSLPWPELR